MSKILIVDDSQFARNLLRAILVEKGYEVCGEAASGQEGIEMYKQMKPDLVFCDILMEGMNGIDCLRGILAEDAEAKVVICTSVGDKLHVGEAMESGAKQFIIKPVKADEVIQVTENLIGKPVFVIPGFYKALLEDRAEGAGVGGKPVFDFLEAFHKVSGLYFDDVKVDEQYLKENGESVGVAVRALISPKMASEQADKLMEVYRGLV